MRAMIRCAFEWCKDEADNMIKEFKVEDGTSGLVDEDDSEADSGKEETRR